MVEGVARAKRHTRMSGKRSRSGQQLQQAGIIESELFIDISNVLLVCNGSPTPCPVLVSSTERYYKTIQSAVNAARPGDWILILPGVYHEKSTQWPTAGVWIQKPNLHIRGLDRATADRLLEELTVATGQLPGDAT